MKTEQWLQLVPNAKKFTEVAQNHQHTLRQKKKQNKKQI